jgi:parallel beta-helix repeat protein
MDIIKNSSPLIINNTVKFGNHEGIFVSWYSNPLILYNNISNYPDGIYSRYFSSPLIIGNKILSNDRSGIKCDRSYLSAINNTILNNYVGVFSSECDSITISDSSISNSTSSYDIALNASKITTVNTTFGESKVYFFDANSSLNVEWYLDLNVIDDQVNQIAEGLVSIYDTNNNQVFYGETNEEGRLENLILKEYTQHLANVTHYTPHTISSAKKGFHFNSTIVTMDSNKNVTLMLSSRKIEEYPFVIANGSEIFVSYKRYSGRNWDVYFVKSIDDGNTWLTPQKVVESDANEIEPIMVIYGSNIYIVYEGNANNNFDAWFTKSLDGGNTWSVPVKLSSSPEYEGHPYIIIDKLGVIYVTYDGDGGIFATTSEDAGESWSPPLKISNSSKSEWNPYMATDDFGVYLTYASRENSTNYVWFSKTIDGGKNWSRSVKVDLNTPWQGRPAIAAWGGEIYVTYSAIDGISPLNYDVKFTKSEDGGSNWSPPIKVYTGSSHEFRNSIFADADGIFIDYQGTANGNWDIWLTKSVDRGNSWSFPVEVEQTIWGEASPQLTVNEGKIYAVYSSYANWYENVYVWLSKSLDGGTTWSNPNKVGF